MHLHEALTQISEIREHIARTEVFRGYRSLIVGFSGVLALLAAAVQPLLVPRPMEQLTAYLGLWVGVATVSFIVAGMEIFWRLRATGSALARQTTMLAVTQFLPCLLVGAVVTAILYWRAADATWMLPGLWCLLFSLGIFASFRMLPRQVLFVGLYYLGCGVVALSLGDSSQSLGPWLMGGSFGVGQLWTSAILYWQLERNDGRSLET